MGKIIKGKHYAAALKDHLGSFNFANDGDRAATAHAFAASVEGLSAKIQDEFSELTARLPAVLEAMANLNKALAPLSADLAGVEPLIFRDSWAGSGRAEVVGGYYMITNAVGAFCAMKSDHAHWVWRGGYFETFEEAEAACNAHHSGEV